MDNKGFDGPSLGPEPQQTSSRRNSDAREDNSKRKSTSSRRNSDTKEGSSKRQTSDMSDNPAYDAGPEDATEEVHGTYKTLDPTSAKTDVDPTYAKVDKPAVEPTRTSDVEMPETFQSQPNAFRYSKEKEALDTLDAAVIDMNRSMVADKPYAGMGKEDLLRFSQTPFWSRFRTICTIVFWLAWLALLGAVIGLTITFPKCVPPPEQPWHETAVIYQIYVRSFYDSDGDGIGDLEGIRQKLEYLADLRVDALILSSFYENNGGSNPDHGYEVVNHTRINPEYGTKEDFDRLLEEAHSYGIHIVLDFIPNYTGTDHPWFTESSRNGSVTNPYWNYYVWKDCDGLPESVNNWRSVYGQSMWTENGTRGLTGDQCYLHQFLDTQPELNLRSRAVQEELEEILRYWLDQGVDGLRVDKVKHLFEDVDLRNEPSNGNCQPGNMDAYNCYDHIYTTNQDEIFPLIARWREIVDEYSLMPGGTPRALFTDSDGSVAHTLRYYGEYGPDGATFPCNFELTKTNASCGGSCVWKLADEFLYGVPTYAVANWMTGTQNLPRFADVITDPVMQNAYTMLKLTMPGVPIMYYGEEIGMTNVDVPTPEDPAGLIDLSMSRDPYRTPMQWNMDPDNAGFINESATNNTGINVPWLPVGDNLYNASVLAQSNSTDEHIPYWFFRNLVDLRKDTQTFVVGSFQYTLLTDSLVSYYRAYEGLNRYLVAINFGPDAGEFNIMGSLYDLPEKADVEMATRASISGTMKLNKVYLEPGDGVILMWPYVRPDGK